MAVDTRTQGPGIVAPDGEIIVDADCMQGLWTEEQYLRMTNHSNRLLEFTDGVIEVLPMPTDKHQFILFYLAMLLHAFLQPKGGAVLPASLRVRIGTGKYREPDIVALLDYSDPRRRNAYWRGADLAVEVVSADDPERDTVVKRVDYAEAAIPEYWIVNPLDDTITVLRLEGEQYTEHGVFQRGDTVTSVLLDGFSIEVNAVLDAGPPLPPGR